MSDRPHAVRCRAPSHQYPIIHAFPVSHRASIKSNPNPCIVIERNRRGPGLVATRMDSMEFAPITVNVAVAATTRGYSPRMVWTHMKKAGIIRNKVTGRKT